jgi:spermine oxidase
MMTSLSKMIVKSYKQDFNTQRLVTSFRRPIMWKFSYLIVFLNSLVVGHAERPSVIIIGAGASGIAAATKLLENSFNNITILEAEDRIGGRINTVKFGQNVVDLGAEYCTGTKGNIAYDLVKDYDVLEPAGLTLEDNIYYSDGTKLDLSLSHDLNDLIFEIYQKKYKGNVTEGKSTGDAFRER